ncbi:caveolin-2 [Synchiropus splendidus]|uniref:caveolin-2 n=1 Tax=Synchiropus splendidus TaxID=270530 RepID=UPI00237DBA10|nr:caveolin-2 [Synchiropus splendidus]
MDPEKEKADVSLYVGEDLFNRSTEPILTKIGNADSSPLDRDPNGINAHLKVSFEDVIAEPASSQSFDKVWIGSNAAFELVKFIFYRVLSTLLAVPVAFMLGLMFGVLSCIHIWILMPFVRSFMTLLPSMQMVWRTVTDLFITPLFQSIGKSFSSIQVTATE